MNVSKGESVEVETSNTIRDTLQEEWDTLVGPDEVDRSYSWYKTVEDSGIRTMRYVFLKEGGRLQAAACCCIYPQELHGKKIPFLEVRSPLGKSSAFFSKTSQHTHLLLKGLKEIQTQEKTKGFMIIGLKKEEIAVLKGVEGLVFFPMIENTYIDLDFASFDEYLNTMGRKARGNIRNTIHKAEKRWNITFLTTSEVSRWKGVAHELQTYLCQKHEDYKWLLSERFYERLEENLRDRIELILLFKDEIPLACGLCLNSPTICQCKAAGIDPRYREYQAYFLMCYEVIRRAIERRQKRIYLGATTYTFKERLRIKKEELYGFAKMGNPVLNAGLRSFVFVSKLWGKRF